METAKCVVALCGKGGTGKSTVLKMVHEQLVKDGFAQGWSSRLLAGGAASFCTEPLTPKGHVRDINVLLDSPTGRRIAFTSIGDDMGQMRRVIEMLWRHSGSVPVDLFVCACHDNCNVYRHLVAMTSDFTPVHRDGMLDNELRDYLVDEIKRHV